MSLDVISPGQTKKVMEDFKKVTCLTKEEEVLMSNQGTMTDQRRYVFKFATMQGDMGFGAKTGDMVEGLAVLSMNPDKFKTGQKYWIQFKPE